MTAGIPTCSGSRKGRMKNKTLQWLYRVTGRKKGYIACLTAAEMLHGASGVLYALFLRNIVDSAVQQNRGLFWQGVISIILLVAGQIALEAFVRWMSELARSSMENLFKDRETRFILQKDYARVNSIHSGEWMNRLTNDTVVVANGYVDILPGFAGMAVRLVSALVMLVILSPAFAAILLPGGLLIVRLTYTLRKQLKKMHKRMQEKDGAVRIFLQERIGNLGMIKSFAAEKKTADDAEKKMQEHQRARMRKNYFSNACNTGLAAVIEGMYLPGVCYCAWGILTGTVSYGTLTAVMQLLGQIQRPFVSISGYLPKYYAMLASAERLMEIETFPEDCAGKTLVGVKEQIRLGQRDWIRRLRTLVEPHQRGDGGIPLFIEHVGRHVRMAFLRPRNIVQERRSPQLLTVVPSGKQGKQRFQILCHRAHMRLHALRRFKPAVQGPDRRLVEKALRLYADALHAQGVTFAP